MEIGSILKAGGQKLVFELKFVLSFFICSRQASQKT
jgi:hypothetical protein